VPESAPEAKLAAIERLGGRVMPVSYDRWWQALEDNGFPDLEGLFIHPADDERVMAGNGTIGIEILEDLPDVDAVVIPYGGGGLTAGVASAVRALRPQTRVYAVEPATAAPLNAAMAAGEPRAIDYQGSFVDGAGGRALLPAMWPRVRPLIDGAFAATISETAAAVRLLAERVRVIAEGAGALAAAVALSGRAGPGRVVCIVSGGNINFAALAQILAGGIP
jgi:threonine dehydratase